MSRSISTLVLLGISALIVLFILSSFYKVFNQKPIHDQTPAIETEHNGTLNTDLNTSNQAMDSESSDSSVATTEAESEADLDSRLADSDKALDGEAEPQELVSNPEEFEEEQEIEVVGTPGQLLLEKPHLQNAVPAVPQAPPSPQGPPVLTAPSEESYSQTGDSRSPGTFPTPIIVNNPPVGNSGTPSNFPAPVAPAVEPAPAPRAPGTGSSSFPAPIINSATGGTSGGSSSFPAPQ